MGEVSSKRKYWIRPHGKEKDLTFTMSERNLKED